MLAQLMGCRGPALQLAGARIFVNPDLSPMVTGLFFAALPQSPPCPPCCTRLKRRRNTMLGDARGGSFLRPLAAFGEPQNSKDGEKRAMRGCSYRERGSVFMTNPLSSDGTVGPLWPSPY